MADEKIERKLAVIFATDVVGLAQQWKGTKMRPSNR